MIKPADENSPFAGVKFDGTLKNEGGTIGFQRVVNERGEDVTGYSRGYREGYDAARKQLRDEIAMKAMQGILSNPALITVLEPNEAWPAIKAVEQADRLLLMLETREERL